MALGLLLGCSGGGPSGLAPPPPAGPPPPPPANPLRAFVANGSQRTISVVDFARTTPIRTVALEAEVWGLAMSPNRRTLYVGLSWPNAMVIGLKPDPLLSPLEPVEETSRVVLPKYQGPGNITQELEDIALTPDGSTLIVPVLAETIYFLSPSAVLDSLKLEPGARLREIEVSPDGQWAAVTGSSLHIISVPSRMLAHTLYIGASEGVTITADSRFAFVVQPGQVTTKVDLVNGTVVAQFQTAFQTGDGGTGSGGFADVAMTSDGGSILRTTSCCEVVAILDPNTGAVMGSIQLAPGPADVEAVSSNGAFALSSGRLQVLDLQRRAIQSTVLLSPFAMRFVLFAP